MPSTPRCLAAIFSIWAATFSGSASISFPWGLIRTRCTSIHSSRSAEATSGSQAWLETPTALTRPFCLASASWSITGRMSTGHDPLVMQCISNVSSCSMPSSRRNRSMSSRAAWASFARVFV